MAKSRLTREDCDDIRRMYADSTRNIRTPNLAHLFGVSVATIHNVLNNHYTPLEDYETLLARRREDKKMKKKKDPVAAAITKALATTLTAQAEAYGDTRTSSTVCTDHLSAAVGCLQAAQQWVRELNAEERRNDRPEPPPKPKPEEIFCHLCALNIAPGDLTVCSGCDENTCPDCMGDDEVCKKCEKENNTE
jgi:hypothetical protein